MCSVSLSFEKSYLCCRPPVQSALVDVDGYCNPATGGTDLTGTFVIN